MSIIPCAKKRDKQGPLNSTASILATAALTSTMNHPFELKDVTFLTFVKSTATLLYVEGAAVPEDATGEQSEEYFKDISAKVTTLINGWISNPSSISEEAKNMLALYAEPKAASISDLQKFEIYKLKKKSTKGVEISFGVSTAVTENTVTPKAVETVVPKSQEKKKVTEVAPLVVQRVNPTRTQATKLIDLILPALVSHMSSNSVDFADIVTIIALEQTIKDAEVNVKIAGTNKKQIKAATESLEAHKAAFAAYPKETLDAYNKMKTNLSALISPELTMFKNEAYTEGILSVKNRDDINHNYRR